MKTVPITQKLKAAIEVLGSERMADCTDEGFIAAIRARKIKPSTIYKIMSMMRYAWNPKRKSWVWKPLQMKIVRRVFAIANKFDEPIVKKMMEAM